MDAFYASVEQLDNPALKGKPIAVGGNKDRGVVAAASYEARAYGVYSAMSSKMAAIKCPHLIFVKPHFERYREISLMIREVFLEYTDLVEPLSLDEAYLDVTENKLGIETATEIAIEIKNKIFERTGLYASAGVSVNKFLAKVASDYRKPNGLYIIKPHQVERFVEQLPIKKFYGVGKVTNEKMNKMGIFHGKDLKQKSLEELIRYFGKAGKYYYEVARGIDNRRVNPNREKKSIGAENTFNKSLSTKTEIKEAMVPIFDKCWKRYEESKSQALTISLKIKFDDFNVITRSKTLNTPFKENSQTLGELNTLIDQIEMDQKIRLIGCSLSNFQTPKTDDLAKPQLTISF